MEESTRRSLALAAALCASTVLLAAGLQLKSRAGGTGAGAGPGCAEARLPELASNDVDWPSFLEKQDLIWDKPPIAWDESGFVGNGKLGAMLWLEKTQGSLPSSLRVELGSSSLFDTLQPGDKLAVSPDDAVCNRPRLPVGRFRLPLEADFKAFHMRLHLYDGEVRGTVNTSAGSLSFSMLASGEAEAILLRTEETGKGFGELSFEAADLSNAVVACIAKRWRKTLSAARKVGPWEAHGVALSEQAHFGGLAHSVAWRSSAGSAGKRLLVASVSDVGPAQEQREAAVAKVLRVQELGVDALTRSHRAWWHGFYQRGAFLSIGSRTLERFYWVNIYKAGSASRPGGPVYDLAGPWPVERTRWPDVHWDLNLQLTYTPFAAADRLELQAWRHDSAAAPSTASGPDARASCNEPLWGGSSLREGRSCVVAPPGITGNLLWVLQVLHMGYDRTRNATLARRLFPLLRRAVNFHRHLQEEAEDGSLHLPGALSPEYGADGRRAPEVLPDPSYDLALYRWGLRAILDLCDASASKGWRLCSDEAEHSAWSDSLARLAPFPEDPSEGFTIYRGRRLEQSHRHFSHLLMVYPLDLLRLDQEEDHARAARSLDHWVSKAKGLQGYSFVAAAAMSGLLGRPEAATGNLSALLTKFISPNTFYREGGKSNPVGETPMFAVAAIQDLLMAKVGSVWRLFPGLDPAVGRGAASFRGLRASGGLLLAAERRAGGTAAFVAEGASLAADGMSEEVLVQPGFPPGSEVHICAPPGVQVAEVDHGNASLSHSALPEGAGSLLRIGPLARGARVVAWVHCAASTGDLDSAGRGGFRAPCQTQTA